MRRRVPELAARADEPQPRAPDVEIPKRDLLTRPARISWRKPLHQFFV
jgi:hypothetical protein